MAKAGACRPAREKFGGYVLMPHPPRRVLRPVCLLAVSTILGLLSPNAAADLLDDAKTIRPALGAKYDSAYAHAEIHTVDKIIEGGQGKHNFEQACQYFRNGESVKKVTTTVKSDLPGMSMGGGGVLAVCPDYYFQASKRDASSKYVLQEFRQLKGDDDHPERDACCPVFASNYLGGARVDHILTGKNAYPLIAAEEVTFEGRRVIRVTQQVEIEGGGHENWYLYFLPNTWAFAGATRPLGEIVLEYRVAYEGDDPLRIKSIRKWQGSTKAPQAKRSETNIDVVSIDFRAVPEAEFRLAALGLEEPATARAAQRRLMYVWISAGALAVLFAILYLRGRRRSTGSLHATNAIE